MIHALAFGDITEIKMKNAYLKLNKIEFAVTNECTGKCKHCSEGNHNSCKDRISPSLAADAVMKICGEYQIQTVMAFGGEPLMHPEAVYQIMSRAQKMNVPKRQVITNGFFSKNEEEIKRVAKRLFECGVNDLLVSVDAFHQETIPLETVRLFALEAKKCGIPIRLQPAFLVSPENSNTYNEKTWQILDSFRDTGIPIGEGNIVFPEGNATKYLKEYFKDGAPENPYVENPYDVRGISFSPTGDVLSDNFYKRDVMEIIASYSPDKEAE